MSESELETSEDVDVISLLANESTEDDSEESYDTIPETADELKALLLKEREIKSKRNASLKKSKQATHRVMEENDALLKRLDQIDARIGGQQPNQEAEKFEQEAQQRRDRAIDNPDEMPGYIDWKQEQSEARLARFLVDKFDSFEQKISGLRQETDPEMQKYKTQMDTLRSKDGFSELDDATLLNVTKALASAKVKQPRGTVHGQPVRSMIPEEFVLTDEERAKMGFSTKGEG